MKAILLAGFVTSVVGLGVAGMPAASADPGPAPRGFGQRIEIPLDPIQPYCFDKRLCGDDFGDTSYCPDTGGFVGPFEACDGLVTGPYAPGGLRPNEGSAGW